MTPDQILNIVNLVAAALSGNGIKLDLVVHTEAGQEGVQIKATVEVNVPLKTKELSHD